MQADRLELPRRAIRVETAAADAGRWGSCWRRFSAAHTGCVWKDQPGQTSESCLSERGAELGDRLGAVAFQATVERGPVMVAIVQGDKARRWVILILPHCNTSALS